MACGNGGMSTKSYRKVTIITVGICIVFSSGFLLATAIYKFRDHAAHNRGNPDSFFRLRQSETNE